MDTSIQALVLGIVQGLTEFLPVSSSGHLILVPWFFGWKDPFINSLAFSVMLHMGTLLALLVYFWHDWLTLIPAGLASIRDRSLAGDPDRKMAWLIVVATIPAVLVGPILNDTIENAVREPAPVALMLCVGAAILWLAERWGSKLREMSSLTFVGALGIGVAQVLALVPGISRSGVSIAAGLFQSLVDEGADAFVLFKIGIDELLSFAGLNPKSLRQAEGREAVGDAEVEHLRHPTLVRRHLPGLDAEGLCRGAGVDGGRLIEPERVAGLA